MEIFSFRCLRCTDDAEYLKSSSCDGSEGLLPKRLIERLGEAVLGALSFMELPLMSHPNKLVYLRLENVQGDYHTLGGPSLLEPKSTLICTPLPKVKAFLATAGQVFSGKLKSRIS